jgi:REP element-mobilizing transposase RayT
MARPLRIEFPGAFYHVYSRGIARDPIFGSDLYRRLFLGVVSNVVERYKLNVHAYCLMSNHYHLLVEAPEANLSLAMRQLHGVYGQAYNRLLKRPGPVFQGRFKACVVDKDAYLLALCRYIVLNPVRARMAQRAEQWPWSSHRAMAGLSPVPAWLTTGTILGMIGGTTSRKVRHCYRKFIAEEGGEAGRELEGVLRKVVLGSESFRERLSELMRRKRNAKEVPKAQRYEGRPELAWLFEGATTKKERDRRILEAHLKHGYTQKAIGDMLGLHYATISRIVGNEE